MIEKVKVYIEKIHPDAIIPTAATDGRAYYDIYTIEEQIIGQGTVNKIHTGLKVQCDPEYFIDIRPRSGLALHNGITINNSPGTIDPDYGEELIIIMINHSSEAYFMHKGDRIAQMNVMPRYKIEWIEQVVSGSKGFGSTGR